MNISCTTKHHGGQVKSAFGYPFVVELCVEVNHERTYIF